MFPSSQTYRYKYSDTEIFSIHNTVNYLHLIIAIKVAVKTYFKLIAFYRESYLRFCSQKFSLDDFHESIHLCNHAIQCKYNNCGDRDPTLPVDNMWDVTTFKAFLKYDLRNIIYLKNHLCTTLKFLCYVLLNTSKYLCTYCFF